MEPVLHYYCFSTSFGCCAGFLFFCTELGVILNGLWLRENVIQIACSSYFFAQNFD